MPELPGGRADIRAHRLPRELVTFQIGTCEHDALHRGPDAVDDVLQVGRDRSRLPLELLEGGLDRAALGVTHHDDQLRPERFRGELDRADERWRDDVAGDANDEEVAEALIEDELRGCAGVRATEDDGEGSLSVDELGAAVMAGVGFREVGDEAGVALAQTLQGDARFDGSCIGHREDEYKSSP